MPGHPRDMTPSTPEFVFAASHEQFTPSQLLQQAIAADAAGFDGIGGSDHFAPWWPEGESGQAWAWLGAAGQATSSRRLGTGVTALVHRYHPAVVAQTFMTLEDLFPGRVFLGVGSGEALNEIPCGADWPSPAEQIERMDQALDVIRRLWAGERVTADHGWFAVRDAKLYSRADRRPDLYVSAFGPQAAEVSGRHGDGLWTLGDPDRVPEILAAHRESAQRHGRDPGKLILQGLIAYARDETALLDGSRGWRGPQPPEVYRDAVGTPEEIQAVAAPQIGDDDLREKLILSTDPTVHVERVLQLVELGADIVCLQNVAGADPLGTIELYGDEVLPAVRRAIAQGEVGQLSR